MLVDEVPFVIVPYVKLKHNCHFIAQENTVQEANLLKNSVIIAICI